jgi:hypothetical protein
MPLNRSSSAPSLRSTLRRAGARLSTEKNSLVPELPLRTNSSRQSPAVPGGHDTKAVSAHLRFIIDLREYPSFFPANSKEIPSFSKATDEPSPQADNAVSRTRQTNIFAIPLN